MTATQLLREYVDGSNSRYIAYLGVMFVVDDECYGPRLPLLSRADLNAMSAVQHTVTADSVTPRPSSRDVPVLLRVAQEARRGWLDEYAHDNCIEGVVVTPCCCQACSA
jgi:hypothetical protein